jgi:CBS domain-containing protein
MLISHILLAKGAKVHTLPGEASLREAAQALAANRVGAVVVVNEKGGPIGVLSERDIVREVGRRGADALAAPVSAAMSTTVITAEPNETVDEGLGRMTDRRIRHLPVVIDGRLAGIVSIGDLVKARIEAVEQDAAALREYITAV